LASSPKFLGESTPPAPIVCDSPAGCAPPRRRGPELDNGRRGRTVVERWLACQVNVVLGGEVTVKADARPARPSKAEPGRASRRS
jgi:hypothetical protein